MYCISLCLHNVDLQTRNAACQRWTDHTATSVIYFPQDMWQQVQLLQVLQGAEGVLCQAEDTAVREVEVRDVNQVGQGGCVERDEPAVSRLPVHVHVCQLHEAGEAAPQGPVGQTVYGQATQAVQVRQSFVWVAQLNVLSPRDVFSVQS